MNSNWSYCPETLNLIKIGDFSSHVTLKFDGWPSETIGHLFYIASSFVHHSITIGEFELKLQSGNAQFGSKSAIYCPVWPWNLMDGLEKKIGLLFSVASSSMHHFITIGEFKLKNSPETLNSGQNQQFFVPRYLEIWRMTLKNNRALLLCYFKLCALFHSHWWIQTGVTVRKRPVWVKIDDF